MKFSFFRSFLPKIWNFSLFSRYIDMRFSETILRKLLEQRIPGVKKVLQILDAKLPDSEKVFQIRVAIWNAESDVQQELQQFIEEQMFSPTAVENLPPTAKSLSFKKHNVMNTYYLN